MERSKKSESSVMACVECHNFAEDDDGNDDSWGISHTCNKAKRNIDTNIYSMPEWCPCLKKDENVEKRKSTRKWRQMTKAEWHYLWWVPSVIVYYFIYYWMSIKVNKEGGNWFWVMAIYGALCPFWLLVSYISKRLFVDGIIYDQLMLITYYGTMIALGQGVKLNNYQWIGVGFLFAGSFLVRFSSSSQSQGCRDRSEHLRVQGKPKKTYPEGQERP